MQALFTGSGPGVQTADGCSVELYRQLSYRGELEPMRASFHPGAKVLELGCGTGRLTSRMVEWGAVVTAVDNSIGMLAEVPSQVAKVLGDIETLSIDEQFSIVVLASNLINHPLVTIRRSFMHVARRHLDVGGKVLIERHDPEWLVNAQAGERSSVGDVSMIVESAVHENELVRIALRYERFGQEWRQSFEAAVLQDFEVETMLEAAGFSSHTWFGNRRRWVQSFAT